jgi:hypothetical protein
MFAKCAGTLAAPTPVSFRSALLMHPSPEVAWMNAEIRSDQRRNQSVRNEIRFVPFTKDTLRIGRGAVRPLGNGALGGMAKFV